jgi:superfamily II DNA or RNA helicase
MILDYYSQYDKGRIIPDHQSQLDSLRNQFCQEIAGATYAKRKNKWFDGKFYAITPTGLFDVGLFGEIYAYATGKLGSSVTITEELKTQIFPNILTKNRSIKSVNNSEYILRDYQESAVIDLLLRGRGIVELGTGGGKTLIMCTLINSLINNNPDIKKIIVITPDLGLVNQTYNDFIEYSPDFSVCKWTGKCDYTDTQVIIGNMGVINARIDTEKWIYEADCILIDECHKLNRKNKIFKVFNQIKTNLKFGFTGTLPKDNIHKWGIIGKIGPVIFKKNSKELRDENYLVNCSVLRCELKYPISLNFSWTKEQEYIINYENRNKFIVKCINNRSGNSMFLVKLRAHGEYMYEYLKNALPNSKVFYVCGDTPVQERQQIIEYMENNNNVVVIAINKIFSTGINIKNIETIFLGASSKSFISIIQTIGRGLRKNLFKKSLVIIDLVDLLHYSKEHSIDRISHYNSERIPYKTVEIPLKTI